jgi:hypothetical protein
LPCWGILLQWFVWGLGLRPGTCVGALSLFFDLSFFLGLPDAYRQGSPRVCGVRIVDYRSVGEAKPVSVLDFYAAHISAFVQPQDAFDC